MDQNDDVSYSAPSSYNVSISENFYPCKNGNKKRVMFCYLKKSVPKLTIDSIIIRS